MKDNFIGKKLIKLKTQIGIDVMVLNGLCKQFG